MEYVVIFICIIGALNSIFAIFGFIKNNTESILLHLLHIAAASWFIMLLIRCITDISLK